MHLIKLPLSPIKPQIVTNKDLIIITNPNSEDEAEAFQSQLVSAKGITENTHIYEVHQEANHQIQIKYLFHHISYPPTHDDNPKSVNPARLSNILPK